MRDYSIVSPKFWIGETGKSLRNDRDAQVLAIYLMTSPHATMTGVYHCPILYMAHETGLSIEGASEALQRLSVAGYCEYDPPSEYVFVVNMASWQIAEYLKPGDNRIHGLKRDVEKMNSPFKSRFLQVYAERFRLGEMPNQIRPSGAPSEPLPSQDQDQDQDQKKEDVELNSTSNLNGKHGSPPGDVEQVFDHWRETWKKHKAKLDSKRRRIIQLALKSYAMADLCKAISGYRNSPHHLGQNERKTPYDDIELFLRDSKHVEAGLQFADKAGGIQWQ